MRIITFSSAVYLFLTQLHETQVLMIRMSTGKKCVSIKNNQEQNSTFDK